MATRRELKEAIGQRYRAAGGWERRQILDEFTRVTGYHRKHALRVLHRPFVPQPARPRKRIYDEAVRQALGLLWEAGDRICGKRLKALLPVLIESMERHGHLSLNPGGEKFGVGCQRGDHRPVVAPGTGSQWAWTPAAVGDWLGDQAERAGADLRRLG
jgi:hypothetical protein